MKQVVVLSPVGIEQAGKVSSILLGSANTSGLYHMSCQEGTVIIQSRKSQI